MTQVDKPTPFKGRTIAAAPPTRLLRRFSKGPRVAEIQERTVILCDAFEFMVFVDGQFHESQIFHGPRLAEYPAALESRANQFMDDGWIQAAVVQIRQ